MGDTVLITKTVALVVEGFLTVLIVVTAVALLLKVDDNLAGFFVADPGS